MTLRKLRSHRDHMFECMKDRAFFDAYMDEPCPKCENLLALNRELVEALEKLAGPMHTCNGTDDTCHCDEFAKEALRKAKEELNG